MGVEADKRLVSFSICTGDIFLQRIGVAPEEFQDSEECLLIFGLLLRDIDRTATSADCCLM